MVVATSRVGDGQRSGCPPPLDRIQAHHGARISGPNLTEFGMNVAPATIMGEICVISFLLLFIILFVWIYLFWLLATNCNIVVERLFM